MIFARFAKIGSKIGSKLFSTGDQKKSFQLSVLSHQYLVLLDENVIVDFKLQRWSIFSFPVL